MRSFRGPERGQGADLLHHVLHRLEAEGLAGDVGHAAEAAQERAAARRLELVEQELAGCDAVPGGDGDLLHGREAGVGHDARGLALLEGLDEQRPRLLGLADHDVVDVLERLVGPQRGVDPAQHDLLPAPAELRRHLVGVGDAGRLGGERDEVGVGVVGDRLHVLVHHLDVHVRAACRRPR